MLSAKAIIEQLQLKPHPSEGGYFRETYRAGEGIEQKALPERYRGGRVFSTAIYYLLTPETFSEMHSLPTDEIFHFYLGDPVTMLQLFEDGSSKEFTLGPDLVNGQSLQLLAARNVWQGSFLNPGGRFALLGTTVAPGFDFADYVRGDRNELIDQYPEREELIIRLTRETIIK